MMRGDDNIIFLSPGYPRHRENRENGQKHSLSGKTPGIWTFILPKHREFWFVQVVNFLILRVKDISIFAMKIFEYFFYSG